ncbi:FtsX-like permease family protein [candidate division KSB1 bacterium]|nr:hypothetical protein [candidate division KSB1 bacterium]RQW00673.1 MAG: FtsX-like permease family protein [candidate division KSB1 bacterium]
MSLLYSIKEAFAGFAKARVSTAITVFTVFFLLLILSLVVILSFNMNRLVTVLNAKYDLQIFLANTITEVEIKQLKNELIDMDGVINVDYISKEAAAAEFKKEFGDDIFDALEENPLPASFSIQLSDDTNNRTSVDTIAAQLEKRPEIDEVVLNQGALNILVKFSSISKIVMYVLAFFVFLGSFFMISNTIRLIIIARQQIIATMKLVGATNAFIRRPFILEGMLQGLLGGLIAFCIIYAVVNLLNVQWPGLLVVPQPIYWGIIVAGLFFGFVGSQFAMKRFL